jgi:hypothetical protein
LQTDDSLSADNSKAVDCDPWWASTVAQLPVSPDARLNQLSQTVSMISGNIRTRRAGHMVRFIKYTLKVFPLIVMGVIPAGGFALVMIVSGLFSPPRATVMDTFRAIFSVNVPLRGSLLFLGLPLYCIGLCVPVAVAIGIGFGVLALREKLGEIPRCRACETWMEHLSRVDRFSYTELSRAHATSDCLAALKENLWVDAAKLLSMHGEVFSPKEEKPDLPLIRYYLDFYACQRCGDESALLTTEDVVGRVFKARQEYQGAYKVRNHAATRLPVIMRWFQFLEATKRASTLVVGPRDRGAIVFAVIAGLFLGIYYYPVVPQVLRIFEHKALITIKSTPSGQSVLVDGNPVVTPKTFFWSYDSVHTIAGLSDRRINERVYRFQNLTAASPSMLNYRYGDPAVCAASGLARPTECKVTINEAHADGGPANRPLIPSYTVIFSRADVPGLQKSQHLSGVENPRAGR